MSQPPQPPRSPDRPHTEPTSPDQFQEMPRQPARKSSARRESYTLYDDLQHHLWLLEDETMLKVSLVVTGIASLLLATVCLVPYLLAAQNTDNTSGGLTTLPTATTLPPSPTLTFGVPKVVLSTSGSGIEQTNTFSVSGATQKLVWSCDPKSVAIQGYNVQAVLYTADNQLQDGILNALCGTASGQSVGQTSTLHIPPGTYYLKMNSEGAWKITITDNDHA